LAAPITFKRIYTITRRKGDLILLKDFRNLQREVLAVNSKVSRCGRTEIRGNDNSPRVKNEFLLKKCAQRQRATGCGANPRAKLFLIAVYKLPVSARMLFRFTASLAMMATRVFMFFIYYYP